MWKRRAAIEKAKHAVAHPDYQYRPTHAKKKRDSDSAEVEEIPDKPPKARKTKASSKKPTNVKADNVVCVLILSARMRSDYCLCSPEHKYCLSRTIETNTARRRSETVQAQGEDKDPTVRKYAIHVIARVLTSIQSHARGSFPYHISTVRIGDRVWHGSSACHNTDIQMTPLRATMIKRTTKPFAPQWPALNTVAASMITSCNSLGAASAPRKLNPRLPPGKDVKQRAATVPMPRLRIRTAPANPSTTRKTTRTPQTAAQAGTASSRCPRTAPSSRANRSRAGSLWRRGATPSRGGGQRTRRSPWTRMSRGRPRRRRRHHRLRPRPSAAASPPRPSSIAWSPRRRRVSRLPGTMGRGICPSRRLL